MEMGHKLALLKKNLPQATSGHAHNFLLTHSSLSIIVDEEKKYKIK